MKKSLLLIPTFITAATFPINCLVSCNKTEDIDVSEVYNKSLEYFVGKDYKGGMCSIPHPTGELEQLRAWLNQQITDCGIETINQDDYGNLWYDVPATDGCEEWKPLCLQAHMDMVWAFTSEGKDLTHPIPVHDVDEQGREVIHTEGHKTSLGADNGAGLAIILALTANKTLSHGPLRCIITADEETGMNGAGVIGKYNDQDDVNVVDHAQGFDYLINLDAETEGDIFVSCAGGYNGTYIANFTAPTANDPTPSLETISGDVDTLYQLEIKGGMGGHSGMNMIKNPVNAPITCAQFLSLFPTVGTDNIVQLVKIDSHETVGNVIPGSATVIFAMPKLSDTEETQRLENLQAIFASFMETVCFYHPNETELTGEIKKYDGDETFTYKLTLNNSKQLLELLTKLKFGVQEKRKTPEGGEELVSSSNVCPINVLLEKTDNSEPHFDFSIFDRSEDEQYLYENYVYYTLKESMEFYANCDGRVAFEVRKNSQYPAYVYNPYDKIREKVVEVYKDLGIKTTEQRTHGGIECAWWYRNNNDIQQASIGPTILDVHSPDETLYLDTYQNLIKVVVQVMQQMDSF